MSNLFEIALWHWSSPINLLYIFRTTFLKNTSGQLHLINIDIGHDHDEVLDHLYIACKFLIFQVIPHLSVKQLLINCKTISKAAIRGVLYKRGVLKKFAKFTEKHLCLSLFLNRAAGLRPAILLKKRHLRLAKCFTIFEIEIEILIEIFRNSTLFQYFNTLV